MSPCILLVLPFLFLDSIPGCRLHFSPVGQSAPLGTGSRRDTLAVYSPLRVFLLAYVTSLLPSGYLFCVRDFFPIGKSIL
jgi:hypothetical protein